LLLGIALWAAPVRGQSTAALAEGLLVRAEFRRDWSNERFFPGRLGGVDLRRGQNTALVGGVWWFGNKPGAW
jgi:hypothetical protein